MIDTSLLYHTYILPYLYCSFLNSPSNIVLTSNNLMYTVRSLNFVTLKRESVHADPVCVLVQLKIIGMAQQSHLSGLRCLLFYGNSIAHASGARVQLERIAIADAHYLFLPEIQGKRYRPQPLPSVTLLVVHVYCTVYSYNTHTSTCTVHCTAYLLDSIRFARRAPALLLLFWYSITHPS